jgi:hypothetical protein
VGVVGRFCHDVAVSTSPPPPYAARVDMPAPVTMDDYDYRLPEAAIAQWPAEPRSAARLLVDGKLTSSGEVEHRRVADLAGLLRPGDVLVVNDTRVLSARLRLTKATGGSAEVLLLEPDGGGGGAGGGGGGGGGGRGRPGGGGGAGGG